MGCSSVDALFYSGPTPCVFAKKQGDGSIACCVEPRWAIAGSASWLKPGKGCLSYRPKIVSISSRLLERGGYGRCDLERLERQIDAESSVAVLGAHIGTYLVPLARQAGHVIGYEPDPKNFKLLEMNVRLNGLRNVDLRCDAVGDRSGEVVFCPGGVNTGHGRLDPASMRGQVVQGSKVDMGHAGCSGTAGPVASIAREPDRLTNLLFSVNEPR